MPTDKQNADRQLSAAYEQYGKRIQKNKRSLSIRQVVKDKIRKNKVKIINGQVWSAPSLSV